MQHSTSTRNWLCAYRYAAQSGLVIENRENRRRLAASRICAAAELALECGTANELAFALDSFKEKILDYLHRVDKCIAARKEKVSCLRLIPDTL
jgi:hypothetical protein